MPIILKMEYLTEILEKIAKYFNKTVGYFFDEEHLYKEEEERKNDRRVQTGERLFV